MIQLQISRAAVLANIFFTTTVTARFESGLFERQAATCFTDYVKCANPGFPSNFCCPANTNCIALAAGTTALCCPQGSSCDFIAPIPCNISLQDANLKPNATLKTTALSASLPTCKDKCCPHGYSCNTQGLCSKNTDQSIPPSGQSSAPSSTATSSTNLPTFTPPPISTASTTFAFPSVTSAPNTTPTPTPQSCPAFPVNAILIFFFAGLLTGIALVFIVLCVYGTFQRRRERKQGFANRGMDEGIGAISSPRLQDESGIGRMDFLRKQPASPSTLVEQRDGLGRQRTIKRVKSFFSRGGDLNEKGYEVGDKREDIPVVPPLRLQNKNGTLQAQRRADPPVTPPQQTYTQYGDIYIGTDDRAVTVSSSSRSEIPDILRSGFTPSPLAQIQKKAQNNTSGLGINRGSGLGVGGSAMPELEGSQSPPSNRGKGAGIGARELLPPPRFTNDDRGSEITTFSKLIEKSIEADLASPNSKRGSARKKGHERNPSGGVGIAGLNPGMPYIYKGSPQSFTKS